MSRLPGPHSVELAALHPVMGTPGDPQFVPHFISPTGLNPQRDSNPCLLSATRFLNPIG